MKFPSIVKRPLWLLASASFALSGQFAPARAAVETMPQDAVVLVDVSGSMTSKRYAGSYARVREAADLVQALLADTFDSGRYPNWVRETDQDAEVSTALAAAGDGKRLVGDGHRIFAGKFGDRATTLAQYTELKLGAGGGLSQVFPPESAFRDNETYIALGRALTLPRMKAAGIADYFIVEVTDAQGDTDGITNPQDSTAINTFENRNEVKSKSKAASFKHKQGGPGPDGKYYELHVNLWRIHLGQVGAGGAAAGSAKLDGLRLPANAAAGADATVSWDAHNFPPNEKYVVELLEAASGRSLQSETVAQTNHTFRALPAGNYQVKVSFATVKADPLTGTMEVKNSAAPVPKVAAPAAAAPGKIFLKQPKPNDVMKPGLVAIKWELPNAVPGTRYTVAVTDQNGKKQQQETTANLQSFNLAAGTYNLSVRATDAPVTPASARFQVGGGSGWLLWLLALLVLAGLWKLLSRRPGASRPDHHVEPGEISAPSRPTQTPKTAARRPDPLD